MYVVSHEATFLFLSYRGDLECYTLPTLAFFIRYTHQVFAQMLPFFDRRVRWREQERGDCILQENDEVKNA